MFQDFYSREAELELRKEDANAEDYMKALDMEELWEGTIEQYFDELDSADEADQLAAEFLQTQE